jgi:hypothetical protein
MPFDEAQLGDPPGYPDPSARRSVKSSNVSPRSIANLLRPKKGERPGGRKVGSQNKKTRAINLEAARAKLGMSPLDAILEATALSRNVMLDLFEKRGTDEFDVDAFLKFNAQTAENAAKAAVYCHSKLAPKRPEGELPPIDLEALTESQLDILIFRLSRGRESVTPLDLTAEEREAPAGEEGQLLR